MLLKKVMWQKQKKLLKYFSKKKKFKKNYKNLKNSTDLFTWNILMNLGKFLIIKHISGKEFRKYPQKNGKIKNPLKKVWILSKSNRKIFFYNITHLFYKNLSLLCK